MFLNLIHREGGYGNLRWKKQRGITILSFIISYQNSEIIENFAELHLIFF